MQAYLLSFSRRINDQMLYEIEDVRKTFNLLLTFKPKLQGNTFFFSGQLRLHELFHNRKFLDISLDFYSLVLHKFQILHFEYNTMKYIYLLLL